MRVVCVRVIASSAITGCAMIRSPLDGAISTCSSSRSLPSPCPGRRDTAGPILRWGSRSICTQSSAGLVPRYHLNVLDPATWRGDPTRGFRDDADPDSNRPAQPHTRKRCRVLCQELGEGPGQSRRQSRADRLAQPVCLIARSRLCLRSGIGCIEVHDDATIRQPHCPDPPCDLLPVRAGDRIGTGFDIFGSAGAYIAGSDDHA